MQCSLHIYIHMQELHLGLQYLTLKPGDLDKRARKTGTFSRENRKKLVYLGRLDQSGAWLKARG